MAYEFMMYPTKVKEIAFEIVRVCDDYKARKINNDQIREVILHYATKYPEKLFNYQDLNPTIKKIIGVQRCDIVNKMLDGYQPNMLNGGLIDGEQ